MQDRADLVAASNVIAVDDDDDPDSNIDTINISIAGDPRTQERPRFVSGSKRPFDPSADFKVAFKQAVHEALTLLNGDFDPPFFGDQCIRIHLTFEFKCPASHCVRGDREGNLLFDAAQFPHRPDIDNLSKFVLDAIEDVMHNNDGKIVELFAKKRHLPFAASHGRIRMGISTLPIDP